MRRLAIVLTAMVTLSAIAVPASAGHQFTDVPNGHPFHHEITWLADAEITTGYADGTFRPSTAITRQAFAAFLWRYAGQPAPTTTPLFFEDVDGDHPFLAPIDWLAAAGITTGYPDDTFRPGSSITRQALAAFLWRWAGEPAPLTTPPSFTDVPLDHPFADPIGWLASTEVTTGYPDGTFRPDTPVTRQAFAAFLNRLDELGTTTLISTHTSGAQGNSSSHNPSVSANGRYVAFYSSATNLVPGDTNGAQDVFVRDTIAGTTTRISIHTNGTQGNDNSSSPFISADGRYITFWSYATNLVAGDTNDYRDVFVRDTIAGTTTRVNTHTNGTQSNDTSGSPSISANGRYITFSSDASNLVAGDSNGVRDAFVRDTIAGTTTRISTHTNGTQGNDTSYPQNISADGRYIAFASDATNIVTGDTNGYHDVFVRDTIAGTTTRVSTHTNGSQGNNTSYAGPMSADGRYITIYSDATSLVTGDTNGYRDVFVRDTATGSTTRINTHTNGTQSNDTSYPGAISADGRYISYFSKATNLVAGDTNGYQDVFVRDTRTGVTSLASGRPGGGPTNGDSSDHAIAPDGSFIVFSSAATDLVSGDTNGQRDIFILRRWAP